VREDDFLIYFLKKHPNYVTRKNVYIFDKKVERSISVVFVVIIIVVVVVLALSSVRPLRRHSRNFAFAVNQRVSIHGQRLPVFSVTAKANNKN
jgi:hypothetical protein